MGQIHNRKYIDMIGYEFQTWKVIALSNKKSKNNSLYWTCECQICHNVKDLCGSEIRLGRTGECRHKSLKNSPTMIMAPTSNINTTSILLLPF